MVGNSCIIQMIPSEFERMFYESMSWQKFLLSQRSGKASKDKKVLKLPDGIENNILVKERVIKILNDVNSDNILHSQN